MTHENERRCAMKTTRAGAHNLFRGPRAAFFNRIL